MYLLWSFLMCIGVFLMLWYVLKPLHLIHFMSFFDFLNLKFDNVFWLFSEFSLSFMTWISTGRMNVWCTIWYNFYNLKNLKNTHGGVLLLVRLQAHTKCLMIWFMFACIKLTHLWPMFRFYNPRKHQETMRIGYKLKLIYRINN